MILILQREYLVGPNAVNAIGPCVGRWKESEKVRSTGESSQRTWGEVRLLKRGAPRGKMENGILATGRNGHN